MKKIDTDIFLGFHIKISDSHWHFIIQNIVVPAVYVSPRIYCSPFHLGLVKQLNFSKKIGDGYFTFWVHFK